MDFQANRCTLDHLYVLTETVRARKQEGHPTYTCFVDCRKAFPSVFKAGLLYKLHRMGVRGKYWRMVTAMYEKITTRVLTGHEDEIPPSEMESLYYEVNTGVREGSILSPLLYILFIDGMLKDLRDSGYGVTLRNRNSGQRTWVGALMYADDLAIQAKSPGELQLMLDIVTEYAKRWRFCINPKKTKVLCFMETTQQAQQRKERFGESWICGGQEIAIAQGHND